jgi:NIMA (never in mitosis gene a)-related kinase
MKILHRDMKSANIFLYKDGTAKLGDLNVSKVAKKGLLYTQTGTPYYASPEVWKDQPYDLKSDIWSLGCVLYEMCALVPPFRAEDMNGLFKRVLKGSYPPIPSHYSMDMRQLIKTLLQVQPQTRPDTSQILDMPIVQKRIKKYFSNRDGSPTTQFDSQAETGITESELLKTIKLSANVFKMVLPTAQYNEKSNYATIPGSQVINKLDRAQDRANSKLNKTNV